jgi:peptidyl-prolyl cis-trans isomerase C
MRFPMPPLLRFLLRFLLPLVIACSSFTAGAAEPVPSDVVVRDGDVVITRAEFEAVLKSSPARAVSTAAADVGRRFELINSMMASRKLAAEADALTPDDKGYWDLQFRIQGLKEQFAFDRKMAAIEIGNYEALANEYYRTRRDHYARIPEKRASSHILLSSPPGRDRAPVREKARDILAQLRAGADFEALVEEYSDDPGSKKRGGALREAVALGDKSISPPYSGALFDITEVGAYSEPTDTQFGVHIIRLDGIEPAGYKPFEAVRNAILTDIVKEVRTLTSKEIRGRYNLTDEAFIDGAAMEALFEPYRP